MLTGLYARGLRFSSFYSRSAFIRDIMVYIYIYIKNYIHIPDLAVEQFRSSC